MQIIQNIRDKGAAIVIAVIALSLIGFILMDAKPGQSWFSSNDRSIGKVNGQVVDAEEYETRVKQVEAQYGGAASGPMAYQIRQNVWDQMVGQKVIEGEFEKLGLTFTPDEMHAMMLSPEDAPKDLLDAYTDKTTGVYDVAKVEQWWQDARKNKEKRAALEKELLEPMRLQALYTKYNALISAAAYYPTWMREKEAAENKSFANISYVNIPYNVIPDNNVKVSDEDIMAYVKKYPVLYKQDAGRMVSYVTFDANASAADTAALKKTLNELKPSFAVDSNAKVFVSKNMSTEKFIDAYTPKSRLALQEKDSVAALPVNGVYGPYLDGKIIGIAKMIGVKVLPDSIKCRHILIATVDRETGRQLLTDSAAHVKADSIAALIRSGASFDSLETQFTADQVAHKDKGVMTFPIEIIQQKEKFYPEFAEFLLNENGETKKTVKTVSGWHYIEILDKKNIGPAYKVAYVSREIIASPETVNTANGLASKISGDAKNIKGFDAFVAKNGLKKIDVPNLLKENDYQLGGFQDARSIIKWAFDAKEGDVSEPFSIDNQYVVAVVTKKQEEGLPDVKVARPLVETTVRNLKKADEIIKKTGATPTLAGAAQAYGKTVETAGADSTLTFGAQIINGIGNEPKVIGASFNPENKTKESAPIIGTNGVYVIKVNNVLAKPADAPEVVTEQAKNRLQGIRQQLSNGWYEGLKKTADIKDNRSKFN